MVHICQKSKQLSLRHSRHTMISPHFTIRHVDEIRRIVFATSLSLHSITIKHSPLGHEQTGLIAITGLQGVH